MGDSPPGRGAVGQHGDFLAVCGMAAQGLVHRAGILFKGAVHHSAVLPGEGVGLNLLRQAGVGKVVFRHNQQAAGVLVNAVNDSRPGHAVDAGEGVAAVGQQRVDQCALLVARSGMDHHALGLVHHQQVAVLVDHLQGDGLGAHLQRAHLGKLHQNLVPWLELGAFGEGLPPAGDAPVFYKVLHGGAGHVLQGGGEELIHPLARLLHGDEKLAAHLLSGSLGSVSFPSRVKNSTWMTNSTAPTVMQQSAKLKT